MWLVAICREEAENHNVLQWKKTRSCIPTKACFWGEHTRILQSRLSLFSSLIFFLSVNIHIFGPYLRKQLIQACMPDTVGPSELRGPGSSFGASLGPVINFPCSSSQITSPQYPSLQKQGYDFSFGSYLLQLPSASLITSLHKNPSPGWKLLQKGQAFGGEDLRSCSHQPADPPFAHNCSLLLLSTVPKQEPNAVSVRPSAGYESKRESLSARLNKQFNLKFIEYQKGRGRSR